MAIRSAERGTHRRCAAALEGLVVGGLGNRPRASCRAAALAALAAAVLLSCGDEAPGPVEASLPTPDAGDRAYRGDGLDPVGDPSSRELPNPTLDQLERKLDVVRKPRPAPYPTTVVPAVDGGAQTDAASGTDAGLVDAGLVDAGLVDAGLVDAAATP